MHSGTANASRGFPANVKDEPRLWLARLLRSRRRDGHGRWLWRLVRLFFGGLDELFEVSNDLAHRNLRCPGGNSPGILRNPILRFLNARVYTGLILADSNRE